MSRVMSLVIDFACERDNSGMAGRISTKFCMDIDIGMAPDWKDIGHGWMIFD